MPNYHPNPIGVPTGLAQRLFQPETRKHVRAAFAGEALGPGYPVLAEFRQDQRIVQWLVLQLPCGHPTPVLARVKGLYQGPSRSQGANS